MSINLICACDEIGSIGYKNKLLYHISHDLKRFKQLTENNLIVMGRKTFESLPNKPLPHRTNVVISRNVNYKVPNGVIVLHDFEQVINHYLNTGVQDKDVFVIGGQSIYEQAIPFTDKIHLTLIHDSSKKSDTYFDLKWLFDFEEVERETHYSEEYQCDYDFVTYVRKGNK